jgi:hypothetical protein
VQISEELETDCDEFRDKLNLLEKEREEVGGGFLDNGVNENFNLQENVLKKNNPNIPTQQNQINYKNNFEDDDIDLEGENIEAFLPD